MKKLLLFSIVCIVACLFTQAQTYTLVANGFVNPIGISKDASGNLFVVEVGSGHNDGKVTMVNAAHQLCPVVTGLTSYTDMGGLSGPYRAYIYPNGMMKVIVGDGR